MFRPTFLAALCCLCVSFAYSQGVAINADGSAPDTSAMLDVKATNKGVLIPRIALTGIHDSNTIHLPKTSLLIYNTATAGTDSVAVSPGFYYWNTNSWAPFSSFNYVLQKNVNTNGKWISGNGGNNGIYLDSNQTFSYKGPGPDQDGQMIFYPRKYGFTGGEVNYDTASMGQGSFAFGLAPVAQGAYSIAIGNQPTASATEAIALGGSVAWGNYAVAIGSGSNAGGVGAVALGSSNVTNADYALALGHLTNATGKTSTSMGNQTQANGQNSLAAGDFAFSAGNNSVAVGTYAKTFGDSSVALGSNVEADNAGSFVFGDGSSPTTYSSADNQMTMRFANGYKLFSNATSTIGVSLAPGASAWSTISDRNRKENFEPVDEEEFLDKLESIPLTTWNYKGQDPASNRHFGPMAQDMYEAFGKDGYGTIGNDSTINQADFDGINFLGVQALTRRTTELRAENAELKQSIDKLKTSLEQVQAADAGRDEEIAQLREELARLSKLVARLTEKQ